LNTSRSNNALELTLRSRLAAARQRFISRRSPAARPPLAISRRRLYILPTGSGNLFALLLIVMLLGATNYSNSLAFALTFWLASVALVSMHHAHRNLLGLTIRAVDAEPVFAGEMARFRITLAHAATRQRRAVRIGAGKSRPTDGVDISAELPVEIAVPVAAPVRGVLPCPRLKIESIYPIGLFRSWSWLTPSAEVLVYPRPAGRDRLPKPSGSADPNDPLRRRGREDFIGQRRYIRGDSTRDIDWKASARSDELLVREYEQPRASQLWLDYERLGALDHEARLAQLALWVTRAERLGRVYGLLLGETRLPPATGPAHYRACLRALALA